MNFLSNKDPVFMQISLSNKIQEKRKTDNVLYKQNYLGTECFFQGFFLFFFFLLLFFLGDISILSSNLIWAASGGE